MLTSSGGIIAWVMLQRKVLRISGIATAIRYCISCIIKINSLIRCALAASGLNFAGAITDFSAPASAMKTGLMSLGVI